MSEQLIVDYPTVNASSVMRFALKTVAEWPITSSANLDARNMQQVAAKALAAMPERESGELARLQHEYDSTRGLWCIDQDPKKVTYEWIIRNAFQLKESL